MSTLRLWVIGAVLIAVVVGAIGWFLGISPRLTEAAAAETERQSVIAVNAGYEEDLANLRELSERLPELQAELDEIRVSIPEEPELPDFLGQLNALAGNSGVALTDVTAETPELIDADIVEAAGVTDLVAIPVLIKANGTSDNLTTFLEQIQFGERLMFARIFKLEGGSDASTIEIGGYVFVLPKEGQAVPTAVDEGAAEGADPSAAPSAEPSASPSP